jgi:hypothetical protein
MRIVENNDRTGPVLTVVSMCVTLCVMTGSIVQSCPVPRRDNSGKQLCETCPSRLTNCKGTKHNYGAGKQCNACYQRELKKEQPDPAPALQFAPSNPLRSPPAAPSIGPYQTRSTSSTTKRVVATPPPTAKDTSRKTRSNTTAMDQLVIAAEKREALLAAERKETKEQPTEADRSADRMVRAIQEEEAEIRRNMTARQMRRQQYLMLEAPRCVNCDFPRTGKKGWDEKNQKHAERDCNNNRWRTIWVFL